MGIRRAALAVLWHVSWAAHAERTMPMAQGVAFVQVAHNMTKVKAELVQRASSETSSRSEADLAETRRQVQESEVGPFNVVAAVSTGVVAVKRTLPHFIAKPPQIAEGLVEFGSGLFNAVSKVIPKETRTTEEFAQFQLLWTETAQALPALVDGFERGVAGYSENGDVAALMHVLCAALDQFESEVRNSMPKDLADEVAKFLSALEDALQGFDDAMESFAEGSTADAVQSVYSGIRLAADALLPSSVQSSATYGAVVEGLDPVFGDLGATMLEYQRRLVESNVCWKDFVRRERSRPSGCPPQYTWDGKHWCNKDSVDPALLETAVAWKRPSGAVPSRCEEGSEFHEQRGAWCYKDCPLGSEPAGARCRSSCMGVFSIGSQLMCGKTTGTVQAAISEMATRTWRASLSVAVLTSSAGDASGLSDTISAFVDAGKGFVHPKCPISGKA
jgi:hypothetical protein